MKNNSSTKSYDKLLALLSFIAIIYSTYEIFIDDSFTGQYIGIIILSSIILFLISNILILNHISEKVDKSED